MRFAKIKTKNGITYAKADESCDEFTVIDGDIFDKKYEVTDTEIDKKDVKILAPCSPSKIVAVGLNYADHAREMNEKLPDFPALFMKPTSAIIGYDDSIIIPPMSQRVDYEAELAIVIGKEISYASPEEAKSAIFGYTCLNDVTARDLQKVDPQWTRAKSFDTFSPIGPVIVTDIDGDDLDIEMHLNGEVKQKSNTGNFIFPTCELVSKISHVMTLYPQDIITTGTPSGIGKMQPGDIAEVVIENIGILRNTVKEYKK